MLPPTQPLPSTTFSTSQLPGEDRFEAWRTSISVLFDVAPLAQGAPVEDFQAQVEAVHLGQLLLGDLHFGAQRFARSHARAAHDGLDHYLVQWYRQGGFIGQHGDGVGLRVRGGDVVVFDMARTQHTVAQDSHVLSLIVPRALGDVAFAGAASPHGTVLRGDSVFGGLLADHLGALHRRLPAIGMEQADDVVRATTQMLAACLRPSQRTLAEARADVQAVTLERIQRHIARNLGAPLTPEALCRAFGLSRHRLYQLFEPLGGVSRYVQQRRLQRAFQTLSNPVYRHLRVADVAARLGFASEAHFSRAFRAAFGHTPSDVRAMAEAARASGRNPPALPSAASVEYADWLLGL
ncbi:helix-turn-helix domain-containing protein [Acidovorax sp. SDU_ACID1]|uniref:helix-turn-helix domain-containing protein n=1 Tax=Acidovorax sp. SDU_ACID1 TaxID=3136632 RepID=UPI0038739514